MAEKVDHCGIKVVFAVDPNKLKTDINCFSSCSPGKLVLTESSLQYMPVPFLEGATLLDIALS